MGYSLGIDLGTTYSAAAVARGDRVEPVTLGTTSPTIPSVVLLRADGEVLTGEAAERRGLSEPTRTAREFKRRLGDQVPLLLGGTPYGAEALMAHLLRTIVRTVAEREGSTPDHVVLTHPANYGPFKRDLVLEAARLAGLDLGRVSMVTEPEAAAVAYARQTKVDVGEVAAIYDFGGGTFDAAVVRRTAQGFQLLGRPDGMERLGGIDIDAAVLASVDAALGGALSSADATDPAVRSALSSLRDECRQAKEALSTDTDTVVRVALPGLHTEVRLTRAELEQMVRPRVTETVAALERAVKSCNLEMSSIARVLLVGGTSRMPIVAQLLRERTGRPVVVDAHPKLTIAVGAASLAHDRASASPAPPPPARPVPAPPAGPAPAPPRPPAPSPGPAPAHAAAYSGAPATPVQAGYAPVYTQAPAPRERNIVPWALGAIALVTAVIVAVVLVVRGGDSTATDSASGTTTAAVTTVGGSSAADEIAQQLAAGFRAAAPSLSDTDVQCLADEFISRIGTTRLLELAATDPNLAFMDSTTQQQMTDSLLACLSSEQLQEIQASFVTVGS